jgi:uncharacterized protein (DUF1499 family)
MIASLCLTALAAANAPKVQLSRRGMLNALGGVSVVGAFAPASRAGFLGPFPGEQPTDLGVRPDGSLKGCPASPNCWSTSGDAKHAVPPFDYSKSDSAAKADLLAVLKAYPQAGVPKGDGIKDGGGNKLVTDDDGYLYMQFTSKKFGFVDDVEFYVKGGKVLMRSASRQGDSDLGVNAARLNYIAGELKAKGGWKTDLGI